MVWQADWMPMKASGPAAMCLTAMVGGWYFKHSTSSNNMNLCFRRMNSGHPQNCLKVTLRCVQMKYHPSRPVDSSRHLLSYMPQPCHTWPLEMHIVCLWSPLQLVNVISEITDGTTGCSEVNFILSAIEFRWAWYKPVLISITSR